MASVLAIISKAIFEKTVRAQGSKGLGDLLQLTRYESRYKALAPLEEGALFLPTIRPPDEQLLVVAGLEERAVDDLGWEAAPNPVPITDISLLRSSTRSFALVLVSVHIQLPPREAAPPHELL